LLTGQQSSLNYKAAFNDYCRYLYLLRDYWSSAGIILLFMFLALSLQFPTPFIVRHVFDVVLPSEDMSTFFYLSLLLIVIASGKTLANLASDRILAKNREKVGKYIRGILFNKLYASEIGFFDGHQAGYIKSRIDEDVDQVDSMLYENIPNLVIQVLTFCGGLIVCFMISKLLTLIVLALIIPYVFSFHFFTKKIYSLTQENHEIWAMFQGFIVEFIGKISLLKIFSGVKPATKEFEDQLSSPLQSNKKVEFMQANFEATMSLISAIVPLCVLLVGVIETMHGRFSVGGIIAFSSAMSYLFGPTSTLVGMNINASRALVSVRRIFEILDLPEETSSFGDRHLNKVECIEFRDVGYLYEEKRGLDSISFEINHGQSMCILGSSGAGKSTIGYLLTGLRIATSGSILINNEPIQNYKLKDLRKRIGYVPQEPLLFSGTVEENLYLDKSSFDLNNLLETVMLKQWVDGLPNGLKTQIHESGVGLSGGEKQRLALARAILTKPDILFLDEVTSALDQETEFIILDNLLKLEWKPILICITHRAELSQKFTKIINV